eukprot:CAMPEP_0114581394 /NCGR_PEP_ID=MMETSP0125-20121206/5503_1 /TAXON_ID=485358 ORGANISM="Aristerostoma sp., Strain ATCC 50986" /NCGR_SAMPLE_ID=MMETSP0125 /ASSEMBLY_ACC=CAM_ASM_000245 /LENGTH=89 /DNA_ID=CAMNT_0001773559 /DNA_START=544 /DNA_END=813 /DNA_ORIENTATION=+
MATSNKYADTLANMASVQKCQGEHELALENFEKACRLYMTNLHDKHQKVATMFNNIGMVCDLMGRYDEALTSYAHAIKIYEEAYGEEYH